MKPEDFLSDDFLKQFKTGQQLNDFLGQLQKRAIEKMLEGGSRYRSCYELRFLKLTQLLR